MEKKTKKVSIRETSPENVVLPKEGEVVSRNGRGRCPFYGMLGAPGVLFDHDGNACGLTFRHSPCSMEVDRKKAPDWNSCGRFNHPSNEDTILKLLDTYRAFPQEMNTRGEDLWSGVPAKEWFEYLMGYENPVIMGRLMCLDGITRCGDPKVKRKRGECSGCGG